MKHLILLLTFSLATMMVRSQSRFIAAEVMYGTFSMRSMKDLQKYLLQQSRANYDLPYSIVSSFPAYFGFSYLAAYPISDKWSIGPRFQFVSTGGRIDYGDYSGYIRLDQLLRGYGLGAYIQARLGYDTEKSFYFTSTVGGTISSVILVSKVSVGNQSDEQRMAYLSLNYAISPALTFKRKISERFFLQGSAGFELSIHNKLRYANNLEVIMEDYVGTQYNVAWDGLRIGIGASYQIFANN